MPLLLRHLYLYIPELSLLFYHQANNALLSLQPLLHFPNVQADCIHTHNHHGTRDLFRSHHHTHIQRLFFPLYFRQLKILQDTHSYQEDIHYLCNNKPHCPNNMLLSVCSLNTGTQHRHYIPYYHVCNPLSRTQDNIPWYLYQKTTGKKRYSIYLYNNIRHQPPQMCAHMYPNTAANHLLTRLYH